MHVPLSSSSIIWYQPMGGNALRLGRHLASHWPHITDISGSLSAGSRPRRGKFWYIAVYLRNCPRLQIPRMFMTLFCPKTTVFEYCCLVYGRAIFLIFFYTCRLLICSGAILTFGLLNLFAIVTESIVHVCDSKSATFWLKINSYSTSASF